MSITTCTGCGKLYEEQSEEEANNPNRLCLPCFSITSDHYYGCNCNLCQKWHKLVPEEDA